MSTGLSKAPFWRAHATQRQAEQMRLVTKSVLDDLDGAVVVLDGLAVGIHVAQRRGHVVVALRQQAAVGRQELQLQGQALLEVLKRLRVVS